MDRTLFNKEGQAVAYITDDFDQTIYLFEGEAVAYVYEERHIYGLNGRHLGWLVDDILFTDDGKRIGFTALTCPVPTGEEPVKHKKNPKHQLRPRWQKPVFPNISFDFSDQALMDLLRGGQVPPLGGAEKTESSGEA